MTQTIGIDLGTTNSVVATVGCSERVEVLPNEHGKSITPSVVLFENGSVVVGDEAKESQKIGDPNVASFFKRLMGDREYRFETAQKEYSAIELSACVLRSLKADAERELGHSVSDAVITIPAYFYDAERKATIEAGRQAGLNILQLINEPTAAAIAYGVTAQPKSTSNVLVYDLGGGTFDVTLLRITEDETRVLTSEGDAELGGKDWDSRIVDFLAAEFQNEYGSNPLDDVVAIGDLWVAAEDAKRTLTDRKSATLFIAHDGEKGRYELRREQFSDLCQDLVERTLDTVRSVLESQQMQPTDINEVLLVGGSTRMPMIQEALTSYFGHPPSRGVNPDEAVAIGAAICAHGHAQAKGPVGLAAMKSGEKTGKGLMLGKTRVTDVTPHSLGMIAINEDNSAYINSIILSKDQPVPRRESRPFQHRTQPHDDNLLEVFMTQGEHDGPSQVTYLGRYVIPHVPHDPGNSVVIEIDYAYDLSGSVQVTARLASDHTELTVNVESLPEDIPARFMEPPPKPVIPHVTVYLAFDLSGSMSGEPLAESQKAALAFLEQVDLTHCSMGVIAVADSTQTVLDACQNASKIEKAVKSLSIGMVGCGNSAQPFDTAMKKLKKVEGPRFVITLADGVWADQPHAVNRAKSLHSAEIDVIAIGFGDADKNFLRDIASCDEGSFFTSLSGLSATFSSIAQVITKTQGNPVSSTKSDVDRKSGFWGLLAGKK
ncbi:Hsp70 family protein [Gimesia maris]|uniref:Chaperone protein DnaK n=1 Tax=Gimesia maris TaxID=122 RepID=A0ABX5YRA0_9PLAN|nr:Hsp70 family protein [Gimesia maris]EDL59221.1 DnaK protein (heat shock protein), C-terminal region has VWA type A domain [Gimesia maris DSM 8797]QEG18236.1 Chaperone protein DnaK [Gimesia maris]QGQ28766.1 Hsp70 family protein [Gimesia maris]